MFVIIIKKLMNIIRLFEYFIKIKVGRVINSFYFKIVF